MNQRLNLALFKLVSVRLHDLVALTLRESSTLWSLILKLFLNWLRNNGCWFLIDLIKMVASTHAAAIVKIF